MSEPRADMYPSLMLVRDELDLLIAEQERRGASLDTKAGLLIGFGGVLVGVAPRDTGGWQLIGQIVVLLSIGVGLYAIFPRISGGLSPRALRDRYLMADPATTRLSVLDTRIWMFEEDENRLRRKLLRMRIAVWTLVAGVVLLVLGSALNAMSGGVR